MKKQDMERIVQGYYDALEEGKILGRKCTRCNHIEFPPYLACNECGGLNTEWVNLNDMRGQITQVLPTVGAFGDPEFRKTNGDYWAIGIQIPNIDEFCSSLLHIDPSRYDEFYNKVLEEPIYVKPIIIQDEDTKIVVWELEDDEFKKMPEENKKVVNTENTQAAVEPVKKETANVELELDDIAKTVIKCAADAYDVDEAELTLATDIREDLSNESMKMIVMISDIEDELNVVIEIQEASYLNTLADFVNKVKEKM